MNKCLVLMVALFVTLSSQAMKRLTAYLPKTEKKNLPAVIICPGGSYHYLDMNGEGKRVAKFLNQHGIAAFVLRYRTAKMHKHPAMIQDLQEAIHYCRFNAAQFGINPEMLGVMGFSAGGHLVGISSIFYDVNFIGSKKEKNISLRPNFVAMIYPVISMNNEEIAHKKSRRGLLGKKPMSELKDSLSLEKNVHSNIPPLFIVQCKLDNIVDYRNSIEFTKSLDSIGFNYKFLLYETGTHGFGIDRKKGKEALAWSDEFIQWLESIKNK
ncbi:MAG: alpha/beta hydrolase [Bacteroidales bacterium]